ncbi:hypothetical protein ACJBU6_01558 [Exserohilum turcicum]
MPPKKKVAASDGTEAEGGASTLTLLPSQLNPKLTTFSQTFRWTLENERKLLVLIQGRYLTSEDYERLVTVFPGTNYNGVKIKVSRFRVEQRKLYDEYGWVLPEGGAKLRKTETPAKDNNSSSSSTATPNKNKRSADDADTETPTKKPRARKSKQKKEEETSASAAETETETENGLDGGGGGGIKEEEVETQV